MKILVNHLTRMQPGYICVAGIDETKDHIRPVLGGRRLTTGLLRRNGGPFEIGGVVDLGEVRYEGAIPEIEDHIFNPSQARYSYTIGPTGYWRLLEDVSCGTLEEIFGDALERRGRGCTMDTGNGKSSLGCLKLPESPSLFINQFGRIRLEVTDGRQEADLSVTDLRLYEEDHQTPRRTLVQRIARRIGDGESVILSVGLTRPFQREGDDVRRHWLQVNNIHLATSPIWDESLQA